MHTDQLTKSTPGGAGRAGIALEVNELKKHYGSTAALDGVSFQVAKGTVHALLGENGAGKSTFVTLLSGLAQPDSGEIWIFGKQVRIGGVRQAHAIGVRTAFQEISLVKDLTVTQNFLLMEEPRNTLGLVSRRRSEMFVESELKRLGLDAIDPRVTVASLDLPTRQKIEIARSVSRKPKLLLLDEPTASLSSDDVQWLARMIEDLKSQGTTIIFISHRMQEVREFCTSLSVLRNGRSVGSHGIDEVADEQVIEMMIGRSLEVVFPPKRRPVENGKGAPSLSAKSLSASEMVKDVSFDLWPGQILGVSGLQGMGQRELFLALFGVAKIVSGEVKVDGRSVVLRSPADAIAADIGINLVPEDRKTEGLFLKFTGGENLSLPSLGNFLKMGMIDRRREAQAVLDAFVRVQIPPRALNQAAGQFSGGNQQKMVIAKWLMTGSRILLLYDPTRGVDIGTKAEIYRLIHDFANEGGSVLVYSSEIAELVNLCTEVMVVYRGRIREVLTGDAVSEIQILRAALDHSPSSERSGGGRE